MTDKNMSDKNIEHYQPKIPKDSVVISRDEFEQHANEYKNLSIKYDQIFDKYRLCKDANEKLKQKIISASKETAEKILKPLYNVIMEHSDCCVNLSKNIRFLMEKYGIDLEGLNDKQRGDFETKPEQEQIEEIAKTMCEEYGTAICQHECEIRGDCANLYLSKKLYEAGYRKASDVIDEFAKRIKERALHSCREIINCYEVTRIETVIDDIADEMRQEVEK